MELWIIRLIWISNLLLTLLWSLFSIFHSNVYLSFEGEPSSSWLKIFRLNLLCTYPSNKIQVLLWVLIINICTMIKFPRESVSMLIHFHVRQKQIISISARRLNWAFTFRNLEVRWISFLGALQLFRTCRGNEDSFKCNAVAMHG